MKIIAGDNNFQRAFSTTKVKFSKYVARFERALFQLKRADLITYLISYTWNYIEFHRGIFRL